MYKDLTKLTYQEYIEYKIHLMKKSSDSLAWDSPDLEKCLLIITYRSNIYSVMKI